MFGRDENQQKHVVHKCPYLLNTCFFVCTTTTFEIYLFLHNYGFKDYLTRHDFIINYLGDTTRDLFIRTHLLVQIRVTIRSSQVCFYRYRKKKNRFVSSTHSEDNKDCQEFTQKNVSQTNINIFQIL